MSEKVSLVVSTGGTPRRSNNDDEVQEFQAGSPIGNQLITLAIALLSTVGSALNVAIRALRPSALGVVSKMIKFIPLAKSAANGVVVATGGNAASNVLPVTAPIPSMVGFPRNVVAVFAAGWDGGTVTVSGTNQFDEPITEDFVGLVGGNTVTGAKAFKTITGAVKSAVGANAAGVTIGTGDVLAVPGAVQLADSAAMLTVDSVAEAVTMSTANHTFAPTTAPNGAKVFNLLVNY